jgi:phosphoribosylamine---glycine ligase
MNSRSSLSGGSRIVDREATRLEHPADELVQLRQRLGRRIDELLPDCLPFALPLVSVDSRFEHRPHPARTPHLSNPLPRRLDSGTVKVLLVGSGGREHALAWKLAAATSLTELHAAPGNPGIASLGSCHPVRPDDGEGLLALARGLAVDLVVIGPEAPLVGGVADELRHAGIAVFGPGRAAAQIEGSKLFAKDVLRAAGVPTAEPLAVARAPCVVKADGLAAGKGVYVCHTAAELDRGLAAVAVYGGNIVIEELLEGEEVSVFALCDGANAAALPAAQDFKRIGEADTGPNTGGMGSYSPVALEADEIVDTVHRPVLAELAARGAPFVGTLYAGLMLTEDGPRVLEFNCRFGDPETQSILPRLDVDLLTALAAAAAGEVRGVEVGVAEGAAVTVVLAAAEYPARGDSGSPIDGTSEAEQTGALVFHAGTAVHGGRLVTNGGRILNVTACARSVAEARSRAYAACELISFPGMRYRRDIALEPGLRAVH